MNVQMNIGRRPAVSAQDPQNEGASPWKIM